MATIYIVNTKSNNLNIRKGPGTTFDKNGFLKKGAECKGYAKEGKWVCIASNKTKKKSDSKWVNSEYLKKVKADDTNKNKKDPSHPKKPSSGSIKLVDKKIVKNNINVKKYKKQMERYLNAFGAPPRFTPEVDPVYNDATNKNVNMSAGRSMAQTWFSNPCIISMCPGAVDYLPGVSKKKKRLFWSKFYDYVKDDKDLKSTFKGAPKADRINGKLYAFKPAYKEYMNMVNMLARVAAIMMHLGNDKTTIKGSSVPLGAYDFGYFTTNANNNSKHGNIFTQAFKEAKNAAMTAVSDKNYIHFFSNGAGASISESISTNDTQSVLEQAFGGDSKLSDTQRNIQFLTGGSIGDNEAAGNDLDAIMNQFNGSNNGVLGTITRAGANYLNGGRLVFPKMLDNTTYGKSISIVMRFIAPYGDRRAIFKNVTLPSLHLVAFAAPKQLSDNMYTYPFLCRIHSPGLVNADLAYVSNLSLERGGSNEASWTVDGISTEVVATFDVTPLYNELMITGAKNPFLFLQNTSMLEYVGNFCGADLKTNNLKLKLKLAKQLVANRFTDIPITVARGIADYSVTNTISKFMQIIN